MSVRVLLFLLLAAAAAPVLGQEIDDCLVCHEDPDLTGDVRGGEVSLYVDIEDYRASVHGDLDCIACHQDLSDADFPHAEELDPVDCGFCHDEVAAQQHASVHGKAEARGDPFAPNCAHCHGTHEIHRVDDPRSPTVVANIPHLCGRCHHEGTPVSLTHEIPQDHILENYSQSIHGEGLFMKGLTVTAVCTSCHTSHNILPHTDPESSIHHQNVQKTCTQCHARIEEVHRKVIEGRLWQEEPHKIPLCVDCHSPHRIRNVFYPQGMANQDCLTCHSNPELAMTREGETVSLYVDQDTFLTTSHATVACAQCHTDVSPSRVRACETVTSKVDCSICHPEPVNQYAGSAHGKLAAQGDPDAPTCLDCHDKHATLKKSLPISPTFPRNIPTLCARCHRKGEPAAKRIETHIADIVESYEMSIHGTGLTESGLLVTATCVNCHTAHGELPASDPASTVHPDNVADTCGNCHHGIEEAFKTSIHWPENNDTEKELPTCEDCHSSHKISRTDLADFRLRIMSQCGRCHEEETLTFFDTYHGKVSRLGSTIAAKCHDCHGTHSILPPTEPHSTLSRRNIVETCAQCHPAAHRRFAGYLTHATHHDRGKYPYLFWAFWGMTGLLVGTLAFALIHTGAWLWRLARSPEHRKHKKGAYGKKSYLRFRPFHRGLHLAMMISFFLLAITGMALKFSYMVWAQVLSGLLGGFDTMGVLHRAGAVILIVVFAVHLWDLNREKRRSGLSWWKYLTQPDTLLFNRNDLRELWGSIRWFLGRGPRPRFGRYTYWEKFDYFAVLWGIAIIGSTGLLLWFPEFFTHILPGWAVNVATIVHSDEALLAVGFIFTIHFFNTHFRPDKFPMDRVIFTGRVALDELKLDKPREYEELLRSRELQERVVPPIAVGTERGFRIFGFVALAIGLSLIALIVYTMLFGYR